MKGIYWRPQRVTRWVLFWICTVSLAGFYGLEWNPLGRSSAQLQQRRDAAQLAQTIDMFMYGGTDTFLGGPVTAYVQLYAPGFDLPHVLVSTKSDAAAKALIFNEFVKHFLFQPGCDRPRYPAWCRRVICAGSTRNSPSGRRGPPPQA